MMTLTRYHETDLARLADLLAYTVRHLDDLQPLNLEWGGAHLAGYALTLGQAKGAQEAASALLTSNRLIDSLTFEQHHRAVRWYTAVSHRTSAATRRLLHACRD